MAFAGCSADGRDLNNGSRDGGQIDSGQVFNPFQSASVGPRCVGGAFKNFLVLGGSDSACSSQSDVFLRGPANAPMAFAELPEITASGTHTLSTNVCWSDTECDLVDMTLNIESFGNGTGAIGKWSIQRPDSRAEGDLTAGWCPYDDFLRPAGDNATELRIKEIAIYQGVKVPLMRNGVAISARNAAVVEGRPGLLRVFVEPSTSFNARLIKARLTMESGGTSESIEVEKNVSRASTDADPSSTFNFQVSNTRMAVGLTYKVELLETQPCATSIGTDIGATFPTDGELAMNVESTVGDFEVVLVPFRYNADGSGRLPDTSSAQITRYQSTMYAMYPAPNVVVTVHNPVNWNSQVAYNGQGWSELLEELLQLRLRENPRRNIYYFGIFSPADSIEDYCYQGCVAGLGTVPGARDNWGRGAIGLGFSGISSAETFVHEIGHALGRGHAPCGTYDGVDPSYPYSGGRLGSWGYNILTGAMLRPDAYRDMMGYCDPIWISDYNYDAIFERISTVNQQVNFIEYEPSTWRVVIVDQEGARFSKRMEMSWPPKGRGIASFFHLSSGAVEEVTVHEYELDHLPARMILVPDPKNDVIAVEIPGVGILTP